MRKRELADLEDRLRFDSGFRVMNGEQEFVTYQRGTTLRIWYGDVADHYSNHWHAASEIALPIRGDLVYTLEDREVRLEEGDVLFIPSRVSHSLTTPPGSARTLILFDPAPLRSLREPKRIHALLNEPLLLRKENEACGAVRQALMELPLICDRGGPSANLRCYAGLMRVFAALTEAGPDTPSVREEENPVPESIRQALNRTFDYVDTRYAENITLESAAQAAGFSRYYFSRIFSRYTGLSFSRYVLNRRVEAASRLLCGTDLRLSEVAARSGFTSVSTFNRVFRNCFGCTPTEYRGLYL